MKNWFEIDKAGLAKILQRKGIEFALFELIQNAWDENGVTQVIVKLVPHETPGYAILEVIDNAPKGFDNIEHAYTLFAESKKKADPEKRGRFNIGEKLVLALARDARITTTKGTVTFNENGRRRSKGPARHESPRTSQGRNQFPSSRGRGRVLVVGRHS